MKVIDYFFFSDSHSPTFIDIFPLSISKILFDAFFDNKSIQTIILPESISILEINFFDGYVYHYRFEDFILCFSYYKSFFSITFRKNY
jgi:hypothetical protein